MQNPIQFFETSPDAGHPDCLCSFCKQSILDDDAIRLWKKIEGISREARFHPDCFNECIGLGLIVPDQKQPSRGCHAAMSWLFSDESNEFTVAQAREHIEKTFGEVVAHELQHLFDHLKNDGANDFPADETKTKQHVV